MNKYNENDFYLRHNYVKLLNYWIGSGIVGTTSFYSINIFPANKGDHYFCIYWSFIFDSNLIFHAFSEWFDHWLIKLQKNLVSIGLDSARGTRSLRKQWSDWSSTWAVAGAKGNVFFMYIYIRYMEGRLH